MIRHALALAALLAAIPASAQSQQDALQARYDRALAAGYKALMLCGAIGHAQANGTQRTAESVLEWELTGIQAPLDAIVRELPHRIHFDPSGTQVGSVHVTWAEGNVQPRVATYEPGRGIQPRRTGQVARRMARRRLLQDVVNRGLRHAVHTRETWHPCPRFPSFHWCARGAISGWTSSAASRSG
ncbi:hypothetical protein J4558_13505 [Leptolyngbya sp. 15MV]|nr:hypothetical protein J4558_13505 [Leptolyngbya sp. 15MV]